MTPRLTAPSTLLAPEMRAASERELVRTRTGLLIGSAYVVPPVPLTADAERLQRALLARSSIGWRFATVLRGWFL